MALPFDFLRPNHREKIALSPSGCWLWMGCRTKTGYGRMHINGRMWLAHRYVYEQLFGKISEELTLDHLCRVRNCVNPDHLEPVGHRENVLRGIGPTAINAQKTVCSKGHALIRNERYNRRECPTCAKLYQLANHSRKRGRPFATHCLRGHEYTPENTYSNSHGKSCKTCQRQAWRMKHAKI